MDDVCRRLRDLRAEVLHNVTVDREVRQSLRLEITSEQADTESEAEDG
jgi:hypothetical protein